MERRSREVLGRGRVSLPRQGSRTVGEAFARLRASVWDALDIPATAFLNFVSRRGMLAETDATERRYASLIAAGLCNNYQGALNDDY